MKFVTLFPDTKNVHLLKDLGMIPCMLHRLYGYDSYVATKLDANGYPYLEKEAKGLKLDEISCFSTGKLLCGLSYLKKHVKEIDILNVYHLNLSSFVWLIYFKLHKKKTAKSYLKLDMSYKGLTSLKKPGIIGFIKRRTMQLADIISVETTKIFDELKDSYGEKLIYLPNGYSLPEDGKKKEYQKKHVILTVGNLGTYEKATDTLLEGFAKSANEHDWVLRLVGTVEKSFEPFVKEYFKRYPMLRERVQFVGSITDKEQLAKEYKEAAVFILSSRQESFGLVFVEAISCGCYIISSDKAPAGYDVSGQERFGRLFRCDDTEDLARVLKEVCCIKRNYNELAVEIEQFAGEHFLWETLLGELKDACER